MSKPIKAVKLIGGEIVMGWYSEKKGTFGGKKIVLEEAQELIVELVDGRMEVQLAPWLPFAETYTFEIELSSVVTVFNVRPNLVTNYKVATGNKK